ncbi:MAG: EamA family transporter [Chitinophagaceae bacterium]|nr:EamA family transporter [Rubrivivax sp.]
MSPRWVDYSFIFATVALSVYGQLILKWRMDQAGPLPAGWAGGLGHLLRLLIDPAVLSSFAAAFAASLAWMAAMTRFELSYAYPFTSLSFVIVLVLSTSLFGENLTVQKVLGVGLIVAGTLLASSSPR